MSVIRRWDKSKPPTGPFALNRDCPQAQGLVAWWPMGGASGGKLIVDLSGRYHLSGTASGMVLGPDGRPLTGFNGSSTVFNSATTPVTTVPLTLAAWCLPTNATAIHTPLSVDVGLVTSSATQLYRLLMHGGTSPKEVWASAASAGTHASAIYGAGWTANTMSHLVGVFTSTTSRAVYYNGALGASNTTSLTVSAVSQINSGRHSQAGAEQWFTGYLGEHAIWDQALSADMVRRLYNEGTRYELWYPLRSRKWFTQSGGSSWTVTLTDLASASDAYTHSVDANVTLTDSASATDALTPSLVAAVALLDQASASDVLSAAAVVQAAITDLASATDSASASFNAAGVATLTDLADGTDSLSCAATVLAALVDGASGSDAYTAALDAVRAITDVASATDSYTASVPGAWTVSLTELAAAVDVIAGAFSGTEIHSAPPLLQRLQSAARAARLSASRAARTAPRTR